MRESCVLVGKTAVLPTKIPSIQEVLVRDSVVDDVLQGRPHDLSPRTVHHHFWQATGLSQAHIEQYERAQRAMTLLQQGVPILDTVYELGYYDQLHLTRSLQRFMGTTPGRENGRNQLPFCTRRHLVLNHNTAILINI